MDNRNELKPCPFCGSEVRITELSMDSTGHNCAKIECFCGLSFEKEWTIGKAKDVCLARNDDIVTAWNRRADDEQAD